jgi:predicted NAD-dependent protein-ADP-ribosyltransferase YbiA (DUF1768 family)
MRFEDQQVREEIRAQKSPMAAKMKAKKHKAKMVVQPMSETDLANMRICLKLKIYQHPSLRRMLLASGNSLIVEDCTKRQRASGLFWGAALIEGSGRVRTGWEGCGWNFGSR